MFKDKKKLTFSKVSNEKPIVRVSNFFYFLKFNSYNEKRYLNPKFIN